MGAARQIELLRAGCRAPDFSLARLENGAVRGTADLGKLLADGPALLAFFKTTCPVCQMTLPFLERIHRGRTPGSLDVYGVSQDDAETTQEFAAELEKLRTLVDAGLKAREQALDTAGAPWTPGRLPVR